ncbi:MAG: hypothetical protein HC869_07800 [Rhodospirillales bacterium]|nr:hypothetical protein [Rhodospirillales bacterium]
MPTSSVNRSANRLRDMPMAPARLSTDHGSAGAPMNELERAADMDVGHGAEDSC